MTFNTLNGLSAVMHQQLSLVQTAINEKLSGIGLTNAGTFGGRGKILSLTVNTDGLITAVSDLELSASMLSDLATAIQNELANASFTASQITDFIDAVNVQFDDLIIGATITSSQVSDLGTTISTAISSATITSSQVSDFAVAVNDAIDETALSITSSQVSDFNTEVNNLISNVNDFKAPNIANSISASDSKVLIKTLNTAKEITLPETGLREGQEFEIYNIASDDASLICSANITLHYPDGTTNNGSAGSYSLLSKTYVKIVCTELNPSGTTKTLMFRG